MLLCDSFHIQNVLAPENVYSKLASFKMSHWILHKYNIFCQFFFYLFFLQFWEFNMTDIWVMCLGGAE